MEDILMPLWIADLETFEHGFRYGAISRNWNVVELRNA